MNINTNTKPDEYEGVEGHFLQTDDPMFVGPVQHANGNQQSIERFTPEERVAAVEQIDSVDALRELLLAAFKREDALREKVTVLDEEVLTDPLTHLANRKGFLKSLKHEFALAHRQGYKVTVAYIDLDGFGDINNTLGHDGGDLALQWFGATLQQSLRRSDVAARVGGDEFAAILTDTDIEAVLPILRDKLRFMYYADDQVFPIGASIGLSEYDGGNDNDDMSEGAFTKMAEKCTKDADAAMYVAKEQKKPEGERDPKRILPKGTQCVRAIPEDRQNEWLDIEFPGTIGPQ